MFNEDMNAWEITSEQMQESLHRDMALFEQEKAEGYDVSIRALDDKNGVIIDTMFSRDESRQFNGGSYHYWTRYWKEGKNIYRQEQCSCDFWQPMEEPEVFVVPDGEVFYDHYMLFANRT